MHARLSGNEPAELKVVAAAADPLTAWAAGYLATDSDRSLAGMLEAAMRRKYSASPWDRFFTGGGLHQFANFNPDHNGRRMSVADAFRHSVNLVFVRLMRDIVRYYVAVHLPFARDLVEDGLTPRARSISSASPKAKDARSSINSTTAGRPRRRRRAGASS